MNVCIVDVSNPAFWSIVACFGDYEAINAPIYKMLQANDNYKIVSFVRI